MPIANIQVMNPPSTSLSDGAQPTLLGGKAGEAIVAELHGKYYTQAYRGNVFIGSTTASGVVPATSGGTAHKYGIWNPPNSAHNIVIIKTQIGLVTVGVATAALGWDYLTGTPSSIATGSNITAATIVAPVNANIGSNIKSVANFVPATMTTTASSFLKTIGVSTLMATSPTAMNNFWQLTEYYDGDLIVAPGTAIMLVGLASAVATYAVTTIWEEVPI